jgi:hypothetical protein
LTTPMTTIQEYIIIIYGAELESGENFNQFCFRRKHNVLKICFKWNECGVTECGYSGFSGYSGCSESTRLNVDSVNPQTTECGFSESTND